MDKIVQLATFGSDAGNLTVFEKILPGAIKRSYFIRAIPGCERGGHRHKKTWQALICLAGSCRVLVDNGKEQSEYILDSSDKCLILKPEDWHVMDQFTSDSILMVLANEYYDAADYIFEPYPTSVPELLGVAV